MIDVQNLNGEERFRLYFAIAAQRAIDRDDHITENFRYGPLSEIKEKVPSYQEIAEVFKEVFGFDYDEVGEMVYFHRF